MMSPYLNIIKKMRTAKELFAELNSFDENRRIEAKSASAVHVQFYDQCPYSPDY